MQIEFIGCTSAGKSTLIKALAEIAREEKVDLVLENDFMLGQFGLGFLKATWWRAVMVHLVAINSCLFRLRRNRQFIRFATRILRHSGIPLRQQVNQFRLVLKQLGRYEIIRRRCPDDTIVIVDEGTVHTAHNLFVHVSNDLDASEVNEFASLVPLPDLVVYVSEREELLIDRVLERGHRRIAEPTREVVGKFVRRAVEMFDQLSKCERLCLRTALIREGFVDVFPDEDQDPRRRQLRRLVEIASGRSRELNARTTSVPSKATYSEILS